MEMAKETARSLDLKFSHELTENTKAMVVINDQKFYVCRIENEHIVLLKKNTVWIGYHDPYSKAFDEVTCDDDSFYYVPFQPNDLDRITVNCFILDDKKIQEILDVATDHELHTKIKRYELQNNDSRILFIELETKDPVPVLATGKLIETNEAWDFFYSKETCEPKLILDEELYRKTFHELYY